MSKLLSFSNLICVYKSLYQINPVSSKCFHLTYYSLKDLFFMGQKMNKASCPAPVQKSHLDKKLWRLHGRPKWTFPCQSFKLKVIVRGYLWCSAQSSWHPTFPWEALRLLSGQGMVGELDVFGVGRGSLSVAPLTCRAAAGEEAVALSNPKAPTELLLLPGPSLVTVSSACSSLKGWLSWQGDFI